MIIHLFNCLIITIILLFILIQDLKYRAIHFLLPVMLFIVAIINFIKIGTNYKEVFFSYIYLVVCFIFSYFYLVIKNRKWINPFKSIIGIGDVVYFLAIIPFFKTQSFVIYFISSLIFSMLGYFMLRFLNNKVSTIPLAGFSGLFLIILIFLSLFFQKNLFQQNFL